MVNVFKKFMGVLVLMLFIMSVVPMALAEEDSTSESTDEVVMEELEVKKEMMEDRVRKRANFGVKNIKKKMNRFRIDSIKAKKDFLEVRERHRKHKAKLLNLKKSVKKCEGEDCVEKKFELKRGFKNHLVNGLKVIEKSLDRIKSKIDSSKKLDDDKKEELLSMIEKLNEKVVSQNEIVDSLSKESTNEEYRAALKDTKSLWKEIKKTQRIIVGNLVNHKFDNLITKHDEFLNGMQMRIDHLEDKGADVSELNDLMENFEQHIKELNENHESVKNAWKNVQSGTESMDVWKEAQKQVREDLRETKKLLREFISNYREVKSSLEE